MLPHEEDCPEHAAEAGRSAEGAAGLLPPGLPGAMEALTRPVLSRGQVHPQDRPPATAEGPKKNESLTTSGEEPLLAWGKMQAFPGQLREGGSGPPPEGLRVLGDIS